MKKEVFGCFLLMGSLAYGEIDLSKSGLGQAWGYHGVQVRANYESYHRDHDKEDSLGFLPDWYAKERAERSSFAQFLERDDRERDYLFDVEYFGFHGKEYSSNGAALTFGVSRDVQSRLGLRLLGSRGTIKEGEEKENKMGIQGFYTSEKEGSAWILMPFVSYHQWKHSESKDRSFSYGFYGKIEKDIMPDWVPLEYLKPSVVFDTHYQLTNGKIEKERWKNQSMLSSLSLQVKNEVLLDSVAIHSYAKLGYEHEFFPKEVYKSLEEKEKSPGKAVGEVGIRMNIQDMLTLSTSVGFKKSFSKNQMESRIGMGFEFRF